MEGKNFKKEEEVEMETNLETVKIVPATEATRFKERMEAQVEEMLSPDNRWFTGEEVGHNPNETELARHYDHAGATRTFDDRHPEFREQQLQEQQ